MPKLVDTAAAAAAARRRRQRSAAATACRPTSTIDRDTAGALRHHAGDDRQRALRCLRPAHRLDHLHPVQPVPRDPRGRARRCSTRCSRSTRSICRPRPAQRPGAAVGDRQRARADRRRCRSTISASSRPTTISFNLAPGVVARRGGRRDPAGASRRSACRASIITSFQGAALAFQASLANELLLILAAIVTVYIVLGVLYESYIHPITILSTLPSAGIGALLALMHRRRRSRHHRASSASSC